MYKVGITVGVFDLFHVGHLNLLEKCKTYCEKLIVAVCDDDYVRNIKHKEPVIKCEDRARILKALKCVDDVIIVNIEQKENKLLIWETTKFDVLFSGDDWKGSERYNRAEKEYGKYGISIEYLPYTKGVSTTDIKKNLFNEN